MKIGYFLSSEELDPIDMVTRARTAEEHGFTGLWISDHFHPWNDRQGQSPFVWGAIGALSQVVRLPITTAVTCPTMRIHPAIIAQAAATAAVQCDGRFTLGVGSGEALNEHIYGDAWPSAGVRLEMLEEAIDLIRTLHEGGEVTRHGKHYTVENARVYTLPERPVPIYMSAFGPKALALAARVADGFINTGPAKDLLRDYRDQGGRGPAQGGFKVCYAPSEDEARRIAHRLWPNEQLPGELAQVLPTPKHFEQASTLVTPEMISVPCGPDPAPYVETVQSYVDAGFDEVYVQQIGPDNGFFEFWSREVAPKL
ncbi:LLM class F420-dependent oxidoreductase [Lentzea sp. NBRC 105346]|uniref:TIGR03557 family F420-dependent LLM class oxidoreductase n=1 Tax=Lentzea sp. NBRC 105346 TaxID=3032205 RepID=UPI0024A2CBDF|nr:TIGR03557 family F420-dependent LLM class oxidoreductase [Lentzea sp. NBRC 105346]GLZ30051.1 LLM class F420-dependent oxidoreductase [Lentzea sp. NBRC 105346]